MNYSISRQGKNPEKNNRDAIVIGDACVDFILEVPKHPVGVHQPDVSDAVRGQDMTIGSGGAAANTAYALALLGNKVGFVGVVGDDLFANIIREHLTRAGVDLSHLGVSAGKNSGMVFRFESKSGGNAIYSAPGPPSFPPESLEIDYFAEARIVYFSGNILTQTVAIGEALCNLARSLKKGGTQLAVDPGRFWLNPSLACYVKDLVKLSDILLPNIHEAKLLTEIDQPVDAAKKMLSEGAKWVVIKMGGQGCVAISEGLELTLPAVDAQVKSSFGAGDVFNSGILHGLLRSWDLSKTVTFANKLAGLKVSRRGTQQGIPSEADVLKLLKNENI